MTRANKSRLQYVIVLAALAAISLGITWYLSFRPAAMIVLGVLLLIPGRLPGLFWREFYQGQQRMQFGEYEQAAVSFEAFLSKIRSRPWLKRLIYLR